jgi:hypothetical protein
VGAKRLRLVGAHEIRVRLGGSAGNASTRSPADKTSPKSVADLAQGKVWLADDVEARIARRGRRTDF